MSPVKIRRKLKAIGAQLNTLYVSRIWDQPLKDQIKTLTRLLNEVRELLDRPNTEHKSSDRQQ